MCTRSDAYRFNSNEVVDVKFWMENIDKYSVRRVSKVLVGCKSDMFESKVEQQRGTSVQASANLFFFYLGCSDR